jgi:hypothetical protein
MDIKAKLKIAIDRMILIDDLVARVYDYLVDIKNHYESIEAKQSTTSMFKHPVFVMDTNKNIVIMEDDELKEAVDNSNKIFSKLNKDNSIIDSEHCFETIIEKTKPKEIKIESTNVTITENKIKKKVGRPRKPVDVNKIKRPRGRPKKIQIQKILEEIKNVVKENYDPNLIHEDIDYVDSIKRENKQ